MFTLLLKKLFVLLLFYQFCFNDLPCQYAVIKVSSDAWGGGVGDRGEGVINVCERV